MAVDNKSDYVGNHGGAYTDIDGMRKQFTTIDHDKKTKISSHISTDNKEEREKWMDNYIQERIKVLLALPPAAAANTHYDFLVTTTPEKFIWNKEEVEKHLQQEPLSFVLTLTWRRTVKEMNWFHPMWQDWDVEALVRGDWEKLM